MKLRFFLAAVVLLLTTSAARAQAGLYLNPIAIHASNSTEAQDSSSFAFFGPNNTSATLWGVNIGGYYDFYHSGGFGVGFDLRDADLHANNAAMNNLLVGLRFSDQLASHPKLRPYFQISGGLGSTKSPSATVHVRKPEYQVFAGLDYAFAKHVDFRALEVGYGSLTTVSSATVGAGGNIAIPATSLFSFSTGLVFRFP